MNPRELFVRSCLRRNEDTIPATPALPPSQAVIEEASVEREWVARAQKGDQEAFAVLVRQHQRQVYQLAMRMLRNEDEASEATQEVFLAAWQHLRSFRGDARHRARNPFRSTSSGRMDSGLALCAPRNDERDGGNYQ